MLMNSKINVFFLILIFIASPLIAETPLTTFTKVEQEVINIAKKILNSKEVSFIHELRDPDSYGSGSVEVDNIKIEYKSPIQHRRPQNDTGIYYFTIGNTTFDNVAQFNLILLQEIYRLKLDPLGKNATTKRNAKNFAKQAKKHLKPF